MQSIQGHSIEDLVRIINEYLEVNPRHLNLKFLDLVKRADEYIIKKRLEEAQREGVIETIKEYPDGYKWVWVRGEQALKREGAMMGHCVGDEAQCYISDTEKGLLKIFSLRDRQNKPHASIEYNIASKSVEQIKGKQNSPVVKKYRDYVVDFINQPPKGVTIKRWDGDNSFETGFVKYKGKCYSTDNLPSPFIHKGSLHLESDTIEALPDEFIIHGSLYIQSNGDSEVHIKKWPSKLTVSQAIYITDLDNKELPEYLHIKTPSLHIGDTRVLQKIACSVNATNVELNNLDSLKEIEGDFNIKDKFTIHNCAITKLPRKLKVKKLYLDNTMIRTIPQSIQISKEFQVRLTSLRELPKSWEHFKASLVLGRMNLKTINPVKRVKNLTLKMGSKIEELPEGLHIEGDFNIVGRVKLKTLPENLYVGGTMDISDSSITTIPGSVRVKEYADLSYTPWMRNLENTYGKEKAYEIAQNQFKGIEINTTGSEDDVDDELDVEEEW